MLRISYIEAYLPTGLTMGPIKHEPSYDEREVFYRDKIMGSICDYGDKLVYFANDVRATKTSKTKVAQFLGTLLAHRHPITHF